MRCREIANNSSHVKEGFSMNHLLRKLESYSDVIVFGCGAASIEILNMLVDHDSSKPIRFCDNYAKHRTHPTVEIVLPEEAVKRYPEALYIIGSALHCVEMTAQLSQLGVPDVNIVSDLSEELTRFQKANAQKRKFIARRYLGNIDYRITEHCNLKCAGCLNFSNIANEKFTDFQVFERDMARLSEILDGDITSVQLFGGEPLLHPQVEEFISYTRQLLPKSRVSILTNGILLPTMRESFWLSLKSNETILQISKYPIRLEMEHIRKKSEEHGVTMTIYEFPIDHWDKYVLDLEGKKNKAESFAACPQANSSCVQLSNGKLYPCSIAAYAGHFNQKFRQALSRTDEDSMDIHSNVTAQEIFRFLSEPVPFCRYCDMEKKTSKNQWKRSMQIISEYL